MNTTENNKIIADFMELPSINDEGQINYIKDLEHCPDYELSYHEDWNWLVEVVEKIENIRHSKDVNSMRFDFHLKQHSAWINDYETEGKKFIYCGGYHSKLLACYDAVIYFIKWYNKQKPKP